MKNRTRVSIIVPVRGKSTTAIASLSCLLTAASIKDEIIIVLNGPEDDNEVIRPYLLALLQTTNDQHAKTQLIDIGPKTGISAALNAGMKAAKGKFILIVHDDVIVSPETIDRLLHTKKEADACTPNIRWGFVGPYTNNSAPLQQISVEKELQGLPTVEQCAKMNHKLKNMSDIPSFVSVATLQNFFLLMTREAYEAVGEFDEETYADGGFEDLDYVLRGRDKGQHALLTTRVFVHHEGEKTFSRIDKSPSDNCVPFMKKWYNPRKQLLCIGYNVQINNDIDANLFLRSLKRAAELEAKVVILDSNSTINLQQLISSAGNVLKGVVRRYAKTTDYSPDNIVKNRNILLGLARAEKPDWVWFMRYCEMPDEKLTCDRLQDLLNPRNPIITGYKFGVYTFWRNETHVRVDSPWGGRTQETLFRNIPSYGDVYNLPDTLPRRIPTLTPNDSIALTSRIFLKDYTYANYQHALQKLEHAAKIAKSEQTKESNRVEQKVVKDEYPLVTAPYCAPDITYLMVARNEADEITRHIFQYASWLDKMLIVDSGSIDNLIDVCTTFNIPTTEYKCCSHYKDVKHMTCNLGAMRNHGIEKCTTQYILFMDPDEVLDEKSVAKIPRLVTENCDAYMFIIHNYKLTKSGKRFSQQTRQPRLFKNSPVFRYEPEIHETLEKSVRSNPDLQIQVENDLVIHHNGFLKHLPGSPHREWRHNQYAQRLMSLLSRRPTDVRAMFALAGHFVAEGQTEDGEALLAKAVDIEPSFFNARFELAMRFVTRAYKLLLDTPPGSIKYADKRRLTERLIHDLGLWVGEAE